jgi:epoxyqueuosine reductase
MSPDTAKMTKKLKKFSQSRGADLFGVADLTPVQSFISSLGPSWINGFSSAVSIGMRLNDQIVEIHTPFEKRQSSLYWFHVYDVVTRALDLLAYDAARWLNDAGFKAFPVPGSTPYNFDNLTGIISHKLVAHMAGLGWIGKSCLLLTEPFGPRVRFVSILTDAPLLTGSPVDKPCGKCRVCVDACPVAAFTGKEFRPDDGREIRFHAFKCSEYRREHPCGLCVSSCPKGRQGAPGRNYSPCRVD